MTNVREEESMPIGWIVGIAVLAAVAALVALILISFIEFKVHLNRSGRNDRVRIDVKAFYGLVNMQYTVPSIVFDGLRQGLKVRLERSGMDQLIGPAEERKRVDKEAVERMLRICRQALQGTDGMKEWSVETLSRVRVTRLDWATDFSLGDAAETAVAAGALWGCKWIAVGWLSRYVRLQQTPRLFVKPVYSDQLSFVTEMEAAGRIRVAELAAAGWKLLRRVRAAENGWSNWKSLLRGLRSEAGSRRPAA